MVAADTSFLFSLYGRDINTASAQATLAKTRTPISLSPFNEFELGNAVRLSVFRKLLSEEIAAAILADFEADKAAGRLQIVICNLAEVVAEASRLSASHTLRGGHRAFDILHVAAASIMKVDSFLSFDRNQQILAEAAGLKVPIRAGY